MILSARHVVMGLPAEALRNVAQQWECLVELIDIAMPITEGMWAYRPEWKNSIRRIASTQDGDPSTVYRFNLCSHTGTYIETAEHKLAVSIPLSNFCLERFVGPCMVVCLPGKAADEPVTANELMSKLEGAGNLEGESLVIATGWSHNHARTDFVTASPFFDESLTEYLASLKLGLLGVDLPAIDKRERPYGAVERLFEANRNMLLLAPLCIDLNVVTSGRYLLCALPLRVDGVCASLCRPILVEG